MHRTIKTENHISTLFQSIFTHKLDSSFSELELPTQASTADSIILSIALVTGIVPTDHFCTNSYSLHRLMAVARHACSPVIDFVGKLKRKSFLLFRVSYTAAVASSPMKHLLPETPKSVIYFDDL